MVHPSAVQVWCCIRSAVRMNRTMMSKTSPAASALFERMGVRASDTSITEEDLKKIKAIDKVRKEQRKQTIEGDVKTYTQLLLGGDDVKSIFESAAKRTDILQYMLVLAGDLVDGA